MKLNNWFTTIQSLRNRARRTQCAPRRRYSHKPVVEGLEERVVPAFDLTVGAGQATANISSVSVLGTTTFTPTASGAFLNANDIFTALSSGNVVVTSGALGAETGNITIAAGLTGPNGLNNSLTFESGTGANLVGNITVNGDLVAGTGGTLPLSLDATGTLTLNADLNAGPAVIALTATSGSIVQTSGTVENSTGLSLSANSGIGASETPLQTRVSNLVAETSTGGIFINNSNNPGPLTIGFSGDPFHGVQVTGATGDIQIVNDNSITINGTGEVVNGPANVAITANGASSNILTGGTNAFFRPTGAAIQAGATLTLSAGQDVLVGDAGTGTNGDVVGTTSVSVTAGRNVIVDEGSILGSGNAGNSGSVTVTASDNISVLGDGSPAFIETAKGPINLTTGAGDTFTDDSANGVISNFSGTEGGNITISADNIVLDGKVDGGASIVTLQQATAASVRAINLGGATTDGELNISNADLAQVTAGILRIGRTDNAGNILIMAAVATQPGFNTLSLRTGGSTTETGTGAISVTNLAIDSFDDVDLGANASAVSTLAANERSFVDLGTSISLLDSVSLTVGTVDSLIGLEVMNGIALASSVAGTALTVNNKVQGNAAFTFDNMTFAASIVAAELTLNEFSSGQVIDLGGANVPGTLGLSATSLGNITARTVQIGDGATGNVSVSAAVSLKASDFSSQSPSLIIDSGAAIVNSGGSITVPSLALEAATGIGASTPLATSVSNLAFSNSTSGAVNIANTDPLTIAALTIAAVGPLTISSNAGGAINLTFASNLVSRSELIFAVNTTSSGALSATATDIQISPNVSVTSTSGDVDLEANGEVGLLTHSSLQGANVQIGFGNSGTEFGMIQGTVTSSSANSIPTIKGGSGANSLTVDFIGGAVLPQGLTYDGGSGSSNKLAVSDTGSSTSHTYAITLNGIVRDDGQPIHYSNVSSVAVAGGNLNNTFSVTPEVLAFPGFDAGNSATAVTFEIRGGASGGAQNPPVSATNTLNYDAELQPVGTFGGPFGGPFSGGSFSQNGTQLLNYVGIQVINLNNAAGVNALTGPNTADRAAAFNGLTANERFVQALYLDALQRPGSNSELASWAAFFNIPNTTQEQAQALIATAIDHSEEARDAMVKSWYVSYLGRAAQGGEELFWVGQLLQGATEEQVLSQILGSAEFFNRAQTLISSGTPQQRYVQALYQVLLYRTGSDSDVQGWVNVLPAIGPQGVAAGFLGSSEFRMNQFQGYYNALMHRSVDPDGLQYWTNSGLNFDAVCIAFESTNEFYTNG
jgi:hypothetical protein